MSTPPTPTSPSPQPSSQQPSSPPSPPTILLSPGFQVRQNHLSSTYQNLLQHQQQNFQIEFLTKNTQVPKPLIEEDMKQQPLVASTLKGQEIFQKYGSLIQNQPIFLRELIFHNYLSHLPTKFQDEFSQIMLMGSGFEAAWWGSLAFVLIRAYRNRGLNVQATFREKAAKALGVGFLFLASSLGFHEEFYIPKLKKCYYKNIRMVDSMMDRHLKLLRVSGAVLEDRGSKVLVSTDTKVDSSVATQKQPVKQATKESAHTMTPLLTKSK